jgi:imidazolonepropionase-like amidohydrolase
MNVIVSEAKTAQCPVAAHAGSDAAVIMAAKAGVLTIEHGNEADEEGLAAMKANDVIFVPTLAVIEVVFPDGLQKCMRFTKRAYQMGIKLAAGGDTGAFAHGENVRELELMHKSGVPVEEVLTAATLHGWESCGGDWCGRKFGFWQTGAAADIIGVEGDPRDDFQTLRRVSFVMKDGKVYKRDNAPVEV